MTQNPFDDSCLGTVTEDIIQPPSLKYYKNIESSSVFKKFTKKKEGALNSFLSKVAFNKKIPKQSSKSPYAHQSMLKRITSNLVDSYKKCSEDFKYIVPEELQQEKNPVITEDSIAVNGDDNRDGNLILRINDILGDRYVIKGELGQGTFGQVVRCEDTKNPGTMVAVKVIKNKPAYYRQAMIETNIIQKLMDSFDYQEHHIIEMKSHFMFKNHLCIVFELLGINLFELLEQNGYNGLSTNVISVLTHQILDALCVLNDAGVIHCDLKPENILLNSDLNKESTNLIKLIDFGSACFENSTVYSYIQSRFYRSPEVLLGYDYSSSIDMWSLGCVIAELFLGLPIFPGHSQHNQIARIVEMIGMPPEEMVYSGKNSYKHFNTSTDGSIKTEKEYARAMGEEVLEWKRYFKEKDLESLIKYYPYPENCDEKEKEKIKKERECFVDFLKGLLTWDSKTRFTPEEAMQHPFITGVKKKAPVRKKQRSGIPIAKSPNVQRGLSQSLPFCSYSGGFQYHGYNMPNMSRSPGNNFVHSFSPSLGHQMMNQNFSSSYGTSPHFPAFGIHSPPQNMMHTPPQMGMNHQSPGYYPSPYFQPPHHFQSHSFNQSHMMQQPLNHNAHRNRKNRPRKTSEKRQRSKSYKHNKRPNNWTLNQSPMNQIRKQTTSSEPVFFPEDNINDESYETQENPYHKSKTQPIPIGKKKPRQKWGGKNEFDDVKRTFGTESRGMKLTIDEDQEDGNHKLGFISTKS